MEENRRGLCASSKR